MSLVNPFSAILRANCAYGEIVGRDPEALIGVSISELTHPEDRELDSTKPLMVRSGKIDRFQHEKRYVNTNGKVVWASVTVSCYRDAHRQPLYLISEIQDITQQREMREQLTHAAVHDALTGLPNRVLFLDRLKVAPNRSHPGWQAGGGGLSRPRSIETRQ